MRRNPDGRCSLPPFFVVCVARRRGIRGRRDARRRANGCHSRSRAHRRRASAAKRACHRHVHPRQRDARDALESARELPDRFLNGPDDYIMGYALIGYAFSQFEIKRAADEEVLIADARLSVVQLDTVVTTPSNQQRVSRNSQTADISGTEQPINATNLPIELHGDLAAMAASLPGVTLMPGLDGGADGFSVLGLGADQNTTTLNGKSMNGSNLPRDAKIATSLTTSPYDGSRGGFSGSEPTAAGRLGQQLRVRGMSLLRTRAGSSGRIPPHRQSARSTRTCRSAASFSGPIQFNKSFYSLSYRIGHRSDDNATLLNTNPIGLRAAGVAPGFGAAPSWHSTSAAVADGRRQHQTRPGTQRRERLRQRRASRRRTRASGQSMGLTYNANWTTKARPSPAGRRCSRRER